ncbi:aminoglycoside adenylyltransferase domain-containing protein [Prauserella muralis]|uniref:Nucleotidyltransferase n=1 Tax=Prauserella muralis TaxID=588067 RepID=A0A2V4AM67_9PSEU|nr:aminoglycoside adenylyltransferase domain-containing protein [Prauserella muralis]PXY20679.1 nucleotidyltransferase [Prauserella muralis]TWE29675.1 streptomycin 3'-adenylyltransferase [Prauserella muralis]
MEDTIAPVLDQLDRQDPGEVAGVYLCGSAATSGLRPDSDVDLLLLTRRSLTTAERAALVSLLLEVSGWRGHAGRFPDAAGRRPIELTGIVADDARRLSAWPRRDFQYGEWLRADLVHGHLPRPAHDPDVVVLLAAAHTAHRVLRGPVLGDVAGPVDRALLHRAVLAVVPDLLEDIDGDERNVLLTLARILVTLETGRIVSKDAAAEAVALTLTGTDRELLKRASAGYLGAARDDWTGLTPRVRALAHALAERAGRHG